MLSLLTFFFAGSLWHAVGWVRVNSGCKLPEFRLRMFLFRLRMLGLLRSLPRRWVRRRPLRLRARSAMTSPTPSECINFLIFLVHLILFIVNKLYVECKLMFFFICPFNYLMYILIIIWSWHDSWHDSLKIHGMIHLYLFGKLHVYAGADPEGGFWGVVTPPALDHQFFFSTNLLTIAKKINNNNRSEYSMDAMYLNLMFINPSGPPPPSRHGRQRRPLCTAVVDPPPCKKSWIRTCYATTY